jgi:hypothetical protein
VLRSPDPGGMPISPDPFFILRFFFRFAAAI